MTRPAGLVDPRYRLRDATIVEWLAITEAEMRARPPHLATADLIRFSGDPFTQAASGHQWKRVEALMASG